MGQLVTQRVNEYLRKNAVISECRALHHPFFLVLLPSRGTKVEKMLTLAPERYTARFCMVAKVIIWCI